MKTKFNTIFMALAAGALALTSCDGKNELEPDGERILAVEINPESITIQVDAEVPLEAVVIPDTGSDSTLTWISADEGIATVDGNGNVKGVSPGFTVVSVRCGNLMGRCDVTVVEPVVRDVILSETNISMTVDDVDTLTFEVVPENAGGYEAVWASRDDRIASVTQEGCVRARSVGSTVITLSVNGIEAQCYVKVGPVEVTSLTLSQNTLTLEEGDNELLTAIVAPVNATYQDVSWESSDLSVATVIAGRVTGIRAGNAAITAFCGDMTATCEVTVVPVEGVRYSVGDVYVTPDGKSGVVFYVTDNGRHGKVIGLEATPFSTSYWSDEQVLVGATSADNGRGNTEKIRRTANYETAYPAFKWLEDTYGPDWYVPAQNELAEVMRNFNEIRTAITNEGGVWLNSMQTSSTEVNAGEYIMVASNYAGGYTSSSTVKGEGYQMCAVYEF